MVACSVRSSTLAPQVGNSLAGRGIHENATENRGIVLLQPLTAQRPQTPRAARWKVRVLRWLAYPA